MRLKEKLSVNIGNATLYLEIYHKFDPDTNLVIKGDWKIGDTTWESRSEANDGFIELVYTGSGNNDGWEVTSPSFITNVCSHFFNDINEATEYVVRILNNDPAFNEAEYLAKEKENANAIS